MIENNVSLSEEQLVEVIVSAIQDKKGNDISILDLRKIENAVFSFFIICDAQSTTQVAAIAEHIDAKLKAEFKTSPNHKEGTENATWVLLDYIDVVVHVFQNESRSFYDLENLWADATRTRVEQQY